MKKARIIAAVVCALAAVFSFAANVLAATPCNGPMHEPMLPEKLRDR